MIIYGTKKTKFVKNVEIKINLPEEKPTIGKVSNFEVEISSKDYSYLDYLLFELVNERTDKRAPLDRVTSRSRYLYRHNIGEHLNAGKPGKYSVPVRIPVHKEPSRDDKFICIKWQLSSRLYMKRDNGDECLCSEGTPIEVEVE